MTARSGAASRKPVSVCGNLASEPFGALILIGFGIANLSAVSGGFLDVATSASASLR